MLLCQCWWCICVYMRVFWFQFFTHLNDSMERQNIPLQRNALRIRQQRNLEWILLLLRGSQLMTILKVCKRRSSKRNAWSGARILTLWPLQMWQNQLRNKSWFGKRLSKQYFGGGHDGGFKVSQPCEDSDFAIICPFPWVKETKPAFKTSTVGLQALKGCPNACCDNWLTLSLDCVPGQSTGSEKHRPLLEEEEEELKPHRKVWKGGETRLFL